jgi:hypothetical protein
VTYHKTISLPTERRYSTRDHFSSTLEQFFGLTSSVINWFCNPAEAPEDSISATQIAASVSWDVAKNAPSFGTVSSAIFFNVVSEMGLGPVLEFFMKEASGAPNADPAHVETPNHSNSSRFPLFRSIAYAGAASYSVYIAAECFKSAFAEYATLSAHSNPDDRPLFSSQMAVTSIAILSLPMMLKKGISLHSALIFSLLFLVGNSNAQTTPTADHICVNSPLLDVNQSAVTPWAQNSTSAVHYLISLLSDNRQSVTAYLTSQAILSFCTQTIALGSLNRPDLSCARVMGNPPNGTLGLWALQNLQSNPNVSESFRQSMNDLYTINPQLFTGSFYIPPDSQLLTSFGSCPRFLWEHLQNATRPEQVFGLDFTPDIKPTDPSGSNSTVYAGLPWWAWLLIAGGGLMAVTSTVVGVRQCRKTRSAVITLNNTQSELLNVERGLIGPHQVEPRLNNTSFDAILQSSFFLPGQANEESHIATSTPLRGNIPVEAGSSTLDTSLISPLSPVQLCRAQEYRKFVSYTEMLSPSNLLSDLSRQDYGKVRLQCDAQREEFVITSAIIDLCEFFSRVSFLSLKEYYDEKNQHQDAPLTEHEHRRYNEVLSTLQQEVNAYKTLRDQIKSLPLPHPSEDESNRVQIYSSVEKAGSSHARGIQLDFSDGNHNPVQIYRTKTLAELQSVYVKLRICKIQRKHLKRTHLYSISENNSLAKMYTKEKTILETSINDLKQERSRLEEQLTPTELKYYRAQNTSEHPSYKPTVPQEFSVIGYDV